MLKSRIVKDEIIALAGRLFQSYEHHLPYGITQCYLPPNTDEHAPS